MSVDIATLGIKVDASSVDNASNKLDKLANHGEKAERSVEGVKNSFNKFHAVLAGLAFGEVTRQLVDLSDKYANIRGRLSLVTQGTAELNMVTEQLYEVANRSLSSFEGTANVYSKLAISTKNLNITQQQLLETTELINKAAVASGVSSQAADAAIVQLTQGFASGTLRGEELNSVMEQVPRLAMAIAEGMDITVGQLRKMGEEGEITSEKIINALHDQANAINDDFGNMPVTIGQAWEVLHNSMIKFVGEADEVSGASAGIVKAMIAVAQNIDKVVVAAEVLAVMFGTKYVAALLAAQIATAKQIAAEAGLTAASDVLAYSIGAVIGSLVKLAALAGISLFLVGLANDIMSASANSQLLKEQTEELEVMLELTGKQAETTGGQVSGLGGDANASSGEIANFTSMVWGSVNGLNAMAAAARNARLEMLKTELHKASEIEDKAFRGTYAGMSRDKRRNFQQLSHGNLLAFRTSPITGAVRDILSGGQSTKDAEFEYRQAKENREALARELEAEGTAGADFWNKRTPARSGGGGAATSGGKGRKAGGGRSGGGGKSEAERAAEEAMRQYDRQIEASEDFVKQLAQETSEIGKNSIQIKLATFERAAQEAVSLKQNETTQKLAQSIRDQGKAWLQATNDQASKEMSDSFKKQNEEIEFQNSLLGMNNAEKAEAEARREIAIRQADAEANGISIVTAAVAEQTQAYIANKKAQGAIEDAVKAANDNADNMRRLTDNVRDATGAFADLFGTAGEGFMQLSDIVMDYYDMQTEHERALAEAKGDRQKIEEENARYTEERADMELDAYGKILGGVKNLFKEKSTAYKVMEAMERAYAVFRTAMALKEILLEGMRTTTAVAGSGARMAADTAETASSVAKSGLRATADGIAAFAKTLASLPFPFNLAAGAAVLAALVAVGVKIAGGGKGKASAVAEKEVKQPIYNGPVDEYGNPLSSYSILKPGRTTTGVNDNPAAGNGGIVFGDTNLTIQGNTDERTIIQLKEVLDAHRVQTVQEARQASAADRAAAASRQRI